MIIYELQGEVKQYMPALQTLILMQNVLATDTQNSRVYPSQNNKIIGSRQIFPSDRGYSLHDLYHYQPRNLLRKIFIYNNSVD